MSESGIFKAAISLPSNDRAAYLNHACGADAELRRDVESLLRAHDNSSTLVQELCDWPDRTGAHSTISENLGSVIGPYTLIEQIGEGGMGVVFRAEQSSPVRRIAALKVIKPGMDSAQFVARLEAERQALALMDHPSIAKFLDAGTTEFGRPFFVMELVDGIAITEYCDRNRLTLTQRLELFELVCQAIQHAHQKGIIHRDIKPTNVLVVLRDGKPTPKVIDFGVAKAVDLRTTEKTLSTQLGTVVGTFEYMSPEQAAMGALDIDTRSDIYSLGVLTYELLTGETPLERRRLKDTPLNEILRVIREEDPVKPSKRLSGHFKTDSIAAARSTGSSRLIRSVRGDLDWIVMKSLEKDPAMRYETASSLARDIRHFLAGEAVDAGPPSARYRLRKLASKHRAALATVAGFVAVLISATAISSWQAIRASRAEAGAHSDRDVAVCAARSETEARKRAEEAEKVARLEADKALAINAFLADDLLSQAEPERNAVESNVTIRELLDRASTRVNERFRDQPDVEAAIRKTIASTYHHLGVYDQSERHWRAILELARNSAGPDSKQAWVASMQIGHLLRHLGRRSDARRTLSQAIDALERLCGSNDPDTIVATELLASTYEDSGDLPQAISLLEKALRLRTANAGPNDSATVTTVRSLASAYNDAGRYAEAIPLLLKTLDADRAQKGAEHPDTVRDMGLLAQAYTVAGRFADAISLGEAVLKLSKFRFGPQHTETITNMNNLAISYSNAGRDKEAVSLLDPALEHRKSKLGAEHPDTLRVMYNLAGVHEKLHQSQKAQTLLEAIVREFRAKQGPDEPLALRAMAKLGRLYQSGGRVAEGFALLEEAYDRRKAKFGASHSETCESLLLLGMACHDANQLERAVLLFNELSKQRTAALGLDHFNTWVAMHLLAVTYRDDHQPEKAIPLLETLVARQRVILGSDDFQTLVITAQLLAIYLETERFADAEATGRDCLEIFTRKMPDSWHRFNVMSHLGAALTGQKKYDPAERFLVEGYDGMKARESQIPEQRPTRLDRTQLQAALTRLVSFYEAVGNAEKAAAWRAKVMSPESDKTKR